MTFALVAIGWLAIILAARSGRPGLGLLGLAILLFHAIALLPDAESMPATLRAHLETATAIAVLSSFAWCIGYWLFARSPTESIVAEKTNASAAVLPHRLVLAILLGLVAMAPGGLVGFAQTGFLRLPVDSSLFSLTYATACTAAFTTTLICIQAAAGRSSVPWFSMALVLLVFWLLGGRTQLAVTAIAFALAFLGYRRIRMRSLILPLLVTGVLALLTLSFRLTLQGESTDLLGAARLTLSQVSLIESYALAARLVEEAGYQGGHYLQVLQQLFPRALFPEKPMQLSRALRLMEARDNLGGLTPGMAGEAFVTSGLVGAAAIGVAFGAVMAWLDNAYLALARLQPLFQALVVCLIPLLAIFVMRGGFDTAIFRLAILLSVATLAAFWRATHPYRPVEVAR